MNMVLFVPQAPYLTNNADLVHIGKKVTFGGT